jgi:carboxylate-amine ligase
MLALLRPVLDEYEEADLVETVVSAILKDGSGTRQQRQAYARRHEATDVVDTALRVGTPHSPDQQAAATARGPHERPSIE